MSPFCNSRMSYLRTAENTPEEKENLGSKNTAANSIQGFFKIKEKNLEPLYANESLSELHSSDNSSSIEGISSFSNDNEEEDSEMIEIGKDTPRFHVSTAYNDLNFSSYKMSRKSILVDNCKSDKSVIVSSNVTASHSFTRASTAVSDSIFHLSEQAELSMEMNRCQIVPPFKAASSVFLNSMCNSEKISDKGKSKIGNDSKSIKKDNKQPAIKTGDKLRDNNRNRNQDKS